MNCLTFSYPINIQTFVWRSRLQKLGEPFSWLTHLLWGTVTRCFSVAHHLSGMGNLRVSDFFQFVGCHLHIKLCILRKDLCMSFCFAGVGKNGKENKSMHVRVTLLRRDVRPKFLKHTFMREFCCGSVSLFLWFTGVFWWWVSKQKNGATTFDLGSVCVS